MKFHYCSAHQLDIRGLLIKLEYFTVLSLALFGYVDTFPEWVGGWKGGQSKIKIKVQLSPAEAEIGTELGKKDKIFYPNTFSKFAEKKQL